MSQSVNQSINQSVNQSQQQIQEDYQELSFPQPEGSILPGQQLGLMKEEDSTNLVQVSVAEIMEEDDLM